MRLHSLLLSSLSCSSIASGVLAQTAGPVVATIGIRWNGFSLDGHAGELSHGALEPVVRDAFAGCDLPPIPSPYSYHALGLFCKAEVKLNSLLPFPVMVRLGDVHRAEELDGKGSALAPH